MQQRPQEDRTQENHAEANDEAKLSALREMLGEHEVDAVLASNPTDIFYLTGFKGVDPQEREAYMLVRPSDNTACGDPAAVP